MKIEVIELLEYLSWFRIRIFIEEDLHTIIALEQQQADISQSEGLK